MNIRANWQYALLALIMAVLAWYYVSGREEVETWVDAPVQLSGMPDDMIIKGGMRNKIGIRVRGPKGLILSLEGKGIVYSLDLSSLKVGTNVIPLKAENIPVDRPFEVMEVDPPRLIIQADRLISKTVPVEVNTVGLEENLDDDYELKSVSTEPTRVTVTGPKVAVDQITSITTPITDVNATRPDVMEEDHVLSPPDDIEVRPERIRIRLEFGVKTKEVTLNVSVGTGEIDPKKVTIKPSKVRLTLEVPLTLAEEMKLSEQTTVNLQLPTPLEPGEYSLTYGINVPEGVFVVKAEPEQVEVTVK